VNDCNNCDCDHLGATGGTSSSLGDWLWSDLEGTDGTELCQRTLVGRSPDGRFLIPFLQNEYSVDLKQRRIDGAAVPYSSELQLVLLSYLVHASDVPLVGKWVSEQTLKGGSLFFQGPHALPTVEVAAKFARDLPEFQKRAKAMGGESLEYGDGSYRLPALPRIPISIVLWLEDEEFPARASFLFDPTAEAHFAPDLVFAMTRCVVRELLTD
jgi:hypothetical protein